MFDLQNIENQIAQLFRDIECIKNGDCCKPICNIEEIDNELVFTLCNDTQYVIPFPEGKYLTDINPVAGDDNEWELVYSDATTAIIPSPYYIVNQGTGEELIYNQAGHPTNIRTLDENGINSKILVETSGDRIVFKVKQYGRHDAMTFSDLSGIGSYGTVSVARFQNGTGNMQFVTKTGGGPPIDNHNTIAYELNLTFIDAYKSIMYFRVLHDFDLTYDDISYQASADKKFYIILPFTLPENPAGFPAGFPLSFLSGLTQQNQHGAHATCFYDIYNKAVDDESNKIRRYGASRLTDVHIEDDAGSSDPGWPSSGVSGMRLAFRFPFIDNLTDPLGGADPTLNLRFEAIGSIILHHDSNTDYLSTIAQEKNH